MLTLLVNKHPVCSSIEKEITKKCVGRELNPDRLLGRQPC